ncbi:MAG: hypothetical protein KGI67_12550 [Pseudomonadota bacterium]|nr:hypothetical protein [Pseudomonadota bacterium]
MMKLSKRQWSLGGLLVATLAAVAWVTSGDDPEPGKVAPAGAKAAASRHARTDQSESVVGAVEPQRLIRVVGERQVGDPFGATSFQPPPPAPPKPAITVATPPPLAPVAAPAPSAPPFPWTFMGRMIEDPQSPAVFLSRGDRLTVAHLGETLESSWKVVGMDARGLRVEYLPLKSSHTVAMPNGSDSNGTVSGATVAAQAAQAAAQQNMAAQIQPQPVAEGGAAADARPAAPAPAGSLPSPVSGIEISNGFGAAQAPH